MNSILKLIPTIQIVDTYFYQVFILLFLFFRIPILKNFPLLKHTFYELFFHITYIVIKTR